MTDSTEREGPESDRSGPPFDASLPALPAPAVFVAAAEEIGIVFEPVDLDRLGRYLAFLADANRRFNLTAVAEPEAMWTRHILDSLTLVPIIASFDRAPGRAGPLRIADVGSGGGLPGIPLSIALPDCATTLIEATGKKARFLEAVIAALALTNARVCPVRAEEVGRDRDEHRESYDIVTSRAVGPLPTLLELTVPLACVDGVVLAIKGERADEEVLEAKAALHALHAHALDLIRTGTGTIVPIRKMRATPKMYPRRAGEPKRNPILGPRRDRPPSSP